MQLVFLGTPQFAVPSLEALVGAGHEVRAVFTQPDRPRGRGQEVAISPVKEAALRLALPVYQPERVRRPEAVELLRSFDVPAMVVVGYGQIIPQAVIDLAPLGIINVHASLLPKYRGAAPVQWAIANGETITGVTTMRINAGLDTGDVLLKAETPVEPDENALELGHRLSFLGAELLVETLARLKTIEGQPQDDSQATYAPILKKEDGLVDWALPAAAIHNRARGFLPWPGTYTFFRGARLHFPCTRLSPETSASPAGTLVSRNRRLYVVCGDARLLELVEVQPEGRKRMTGEAFANGQRFKQNERLGETSI